MPFFLTRTQPECPVARTLDIIGERWTILILRDLLLSGPRKFQDFEASLKGISPNTLSARLKRLEDTKSSSGTCTSSIRRVPSTGSRKRAALLAPWCRRCAISGWSTLVRANSTYMLIRHREAAFAAVAIQSNIEDLDLDCFAALAMTVTVI